MNAFRNASFATVATALVFGTGLGFPAAAGATELASQDSNSCTVSNVTAATDQTQAPWEIKNADPGQLTDADGTPLTGNGVKVAVIDTGIQAQAQLSVSGGVVLNGETTGYTADDDGHGTMVASIIAAQKEQGGNGMQGIAPGVQLLSIREAGCNAPDGNDEDTMATGIDDAVDEGADVINISQDGYDDDTKLEDAVQYAYSQGVVIVTSAGNQGDRDTTGSNGKDYGVNPRTYPASYPTVLAVGAVDQYGTVPTFSETGSAANSYYIGVVAPGVAVEGLVPKGTLAVDDGTSFASPYVAAEAALIMEEHGWAGSGHRTEARAYEVIKIIEATADGDGAYSASQGWGEADIQNALMTKLADGDSLVSPGGSIGGLTRMLGAGPNADGQATTSQTDVNRTVIKPYVAASVNEEAQKQQRWAYIALGAGVLVAIVALAGAAVARDAARRRGAARL
jgi:membrane-anchored mycosin MYCP